MANASDQTAYLFVYGTLRRDSGHPMHEFLAAQAEFVSRGTFQGRLYHLGSYPGAVAAPADAHLVHGEIYQLHQPEAALAALDDYEGCGPDSAADINFRRELITVSTSSGQLLRARSYLYTGSTEELPVIASGDYFAPLDTGD